MKILLTSFGLVFLYACTLEIKQSSEGGDWIKGNKEDQIKLIEKHLRGFDQAMVEIGYRYQELYWAGKDKNWEYGEYQIEKIELAFKNGLERRPKRAASAKDFIEWVIPKVKEALVSRNQELFAESFNTMTIQCNYCHSLEKLPYMYIETPSIRQSPIRWYEPENPIKNIQQ
ncbi:MAG: hypothetical protein IPM48_02115 [Saprospiraceae bacterium]|nr:hypothetical protein [Saprospiraceae bacterium]